MEFSTYVKSVLDSFKKARILKTIENLNAIYIDYIDEQQHIINYKLIYLPFNETIYKNSEAIQWKSNDLNSQSESMENKVFYKNQQVYSMKNSQYTIGSKRKMVLNN